MKLRHHERYFGAGSPLANRSAGSSLRGGVRTSGQNFAFLLLTFQIHLSLVFLPPHRRKGKRRKRKKIYLRRKILKYAPIMTTDTSSLESQRLELENNVQRLRESLYKWRLWEAEYDGLKDKIASLREDATQVELLQHGLAFDGSVVDEKEVRALVFSGLGNSATARSRNQVTQLLDRRLDYVKENVRMMEKRLKNTEDERDKLLGSELLPASGSGQRGVDYRVTEITEELDENDNVVSSSMSTPRDQASGLSEALEILKKAGVKDLPDQSTKVETATGADDINGTDIEPTPKLTSKVEQSNDNIAPISGLQHDTAPVYIQTSELDSEERLVTEIDEPPEDAKLRREMLAYSLNEVGTVVAELEVDEEGSEFSVEDEEYYCQPEYVESDDEDEYGRTTSRVLTSEYHQKMQELEQKLNAKSLTNIGQDISVLPEEVRRELERPAAVKVELERDKELTEQNQVKSRKKVSFAAELDIAPAPRFPLSNTKPSFHATKAPEAPPVSLSIVEHTTNSRRGDNQATLTKSVKPKKVSRFKSVRNTGADASTELIFPEAALTSSNGTVKETSKESSSPTPFGLFPAGLREPKPFLQPIKDSITDKLQSENMNASIHAPQRSSPLQPNPLGGKTLADQLVERDISTRNVHPPDSEEIDEELHRKQIATEFYDMANHKIFQNGGFLGNSEDELDIVRIDEANEEEPSRYVSRFMAARMKPMTR